MCESIVGPGASDCVVYVNEGISVEARKQELIEKRYCRSRGDAIKRRKRAVAQLG